ncbi:alpha/beta hydrolase [Aestuariispira ectoiniformans]|uniref:alpha/beta hydrolase n=1 Tax=Aestuariispira ectoiniformans TaxID=2775080 RepID=UPI00223C332B|nr:alpha/beta hydrolase [Aestuariispira ectoiniformans]
MIRSARLAIPLLCLLLLGACAPRVEHAGPTIQNAILTAENFVMPDGNKLPYRLWRDETGLPPKAVILALHGFNDYSKSYSDPAAYWATRGIWTYAYDQRGFGETEQHGLWPGGDTLRADLREAAHLLRRKHPDVPLILLGESMGGAVIATAEAFGARPESDRIILSAPAVWGRQQLPWLQEGAAWVIVHLIPWAKMQPRTHLRPSDNIEMLRALGRDPLIIKKTRLDSAWGLLNLMTEAQQAAPLLSEPALILYGQDEELIPDESRQHFLGSLPKGPERHWSLIEYEDGFHMLMRDLNAKRVWEDIADYALTGAAPALRATVDKDGRISAREPLPDTGQ